MSAALRWEDMDEEAHDAAFDRAEDAWHSKGLQARAVAVPSELLRLVEHDADLVRIHARLLRLELEDEATADPDRLRIRLGLAQERLSDIRRTVARAEARLALAVPAIQGEDQPDA